MKWGYPIASEALDLEIYQLACIVAASRELAPLAPAFPGLAGFRATFELSEASRKLIALAVIIRNGMDAWPGASQLAARRAPKSVGVLIPDTAQPDESEELGFREACNKIIHAETRDFSPENPGAVEPITLGEIVRLFGKKGSKEWQADLRLYSFLDGVPAFVERSDLPFERTMSVVTRWRRRRSTACSADK